MYCSKCGKKLQDDAAFCVNCGTKVGRDTASNNSYSQSYSAQYEETPSKLPVIIGVASVVMLLTVGGIVAFILLSGKSAKEDVAVTNVAQADGVGETGSDKKIAQGDAAATADGVGETDSATNSDHEAGTSTDKTTAKSADKNKKKKKSKSQTNAFIIADSNSRSLTQEELSLLSPKELTYARNEIFARYGYVFKSPELNEYFGKQKWYTPDPNFTGALSPVESANAEMILNYQKTAHQIYTPLPQQTSDGEYHTFCENVIDFTLRDGYLIIETVPNDGDDDGIGTVTGRTDSTQYCLGFVEEPFTPNATFEEVKAFIEKERSNYENCVSNNYEYEDSSGLIIEIQNGQVLKVRTASP